MAGDVPMGSLGDLPVLEQFVHDSSACMRDMVVVVTQLMESQRDLLEVVDGLSVELAAVSAQLAELRVGRGDAVPPEGLTRDADAVQALRQAAALAQRAATLLAHTRWSEADVPQLRRVDG